MRRRGSDRPLAVVLLLAVAVRGGTARGACTRSSSSPSPGSGSSSRTISRMRRLQRAMAGAIHRAARRRSRARKEARDHPGAHALARRPACPDFLQHRPDWGRLAPVAHPRRVDPDFLFGMLDYTVYWSGPDELDYFNRPPLWRQYGLTRHTARDAVSPKKYLVPFVRARPFSQSAVVFGDPVFRGDSGEGRQRLPSLHPFGKSGF